MSAEERFLIESTAIRFFTQVIACHSVNQLFFAKVLCDVIREQGVSRAGNFRVSPHLGGVMCLSLLCLFQLFLSLLCLFQLFPESLAVFVGTFKGDHESHW